MIRRLRVKFVAVNMAIVTILLCAIFGLVLYFTSAGLERESLGMMQSIAAQPFHLGVPGERDDDVRLPVFTLQITPYGELVSTGGGYYDLSDSAFLDSLIASVSAETRPLGVIEEFGLRYYRAETPIGQCIVFADISAERATLSNLVRTCLLLGACSFLAFLWVSIMLSKWAVRPVERAWDQQREFVAAASHELKTPLTVIMTNAELLSGGVSDEKKRKALLGAILTMSGQMKSLIEQMLELARADTAVERPQFSDVDLSAAVVRASLPFEAVFFEQGKTLTVGPESGIRVRGDARALEQVVEILLDNAQKYGAPGGETRVTLERSGRTHCELTVASEGEPLSSAEAKDIFKRFYRADTARSRTGSFGLGLSIAETIVGQHQGSIRAESAGGFNRFTVRLPCAHG